MEDKEKEIIKLRNEIEALDKEIALLFEKRMNVAKKIGDLKKELKLEIFDKEREAYLLSKNTQNISDDEIKAYYKRLLECMLSLSKEYQKNGK